MLQQMAWWLCYSSYRNNLISWHTVANSTNDISLDIVNSQAGQITKTAQKMYGTYWASLLQVKAFSSTSFITSSVDSGLSLWKEDGLRLKAVKGKHLVDLNMVNTNREILCSLYASGTSWVVGLFVPQVMSSISMSSDILNRRMVLLG